MALSFSRAGTLQRSPAEAPSCSYRSAAFGVLCGARQRQGCPGSRRSAPISVARASVMGDQGDGRPEQEALSGPLQAGLHYVSALHAFSRPHTMIGTALSVASISLLALGGVEPGPSAVTALLQALSSALLMNIAIVGINQLYDIEIDKVNKPYLPLASGALSPPQGLAIVVASAVGGTAIGLASGSPPLISTLLVSLALGVIYSADLPFMRWKRSPLLAAGCILAVRAIIVQLGFYTHMREAVAAAAATTAATAVGASAAVASAPSAAASGVAGMLAVLGTLSPSMLFVMGFMLFFSIVIALFKDLPDVVGDRKAGLRTLSVRLGEGSVFRICVAMLAAAYVWAMGASLVLPGVAVTKGALFVGHAVLCGLLLHRARSVDTRRKEHLTDYYMFVWKLFYAEYLLIPLFG